MSDTYFPPAESASGWRVLDSAEDVRAVAGIDPDRLADLRAWLLASDERDFAAVVIRHGHIALQVERNHSAVDDIGNAKSTAKAIMTTVLAIAAEESKQGRLPMQFSFDSPAFPLIPWAWPLSDPRKAQISVRQLLNHTSGITPESTGAPNRGPWEFITGHADDPRVVHLAFDPGRDLDYSTHGMYHAALLCEHVTGMPYDRYAISRLFQPLGIEHWWFEWISGDAQHGDHPSHTLGLPACDLARVAYCMLHDGQWQGQQIIPRWFIEETARPSHNITGPKTFGWHAEYWTTGWELGSRLGGDSGRGIPADARYKAGSGGQLVGFIPSLDVVIARQTGSSGDWEFAEFVRRAAAVV